MPEIKTKLLRLEEGETYTAGAEDYVITENHSISDVVRWAIEQAGPDGWEDIVCLAEMEKK